MSAFTKWIEEISGGNMSNRELAKKVGMTVATFHRKWTEDAFVSDDAITIARAFGRSPIEALVILGSLTEEEASKAARGYSLSEYTTLELSQELLRRIQASAEVPDYLDKPVDEAGGGGGENLRQLGAGPSPRSAIHLEYVPQKSLEYKSPRSLVRAPGLDYVVWPIV